MYLRWRFQSWGHFLSSLNQFSTRSSSMACVQLCKIPLFPWPSMASMVAWTSIESIGWIPWKWSPIAPWIPQKLSVESMETYRKHRKLMPLNIPLNFHCFLEVHGDRVRILHGSGSVIHGIPWKSQTGVVQQMHVWSDVFWVTESKSNPYWYL